MFLAHKKIIQWIQTFVIAVGSSKAPPTRSKGKKGKSLWYFLLNSYFKNHSNINSFVQGKVTVITDMLQ